jgi:hypothetical protein
MRMKRCTQEKGKSRNTGTPIFVDIEESEDE